MLNYTNDNKISDAEICQQLIKLIQMLHLRDSQMSVTEHEVPVMLTIRECVERYGLSDYTIRKLVKQGKVVSIPTGEGKNGKILINAASLEAYLNGIAA